jgi:hypothetical protein
MLPVYQLKSPCHWSIPWKCFMSTHAKILSLNPVLTIRLYTMYRYLFTEVCMSGLCCMSNVYTLSLKHIHILTMLPVHHMLKYLVIGVPDLIMLHKNGCLPFECLVIETCHDCAACYLWKYLFTEVHMSWLCCMSTKYCTLLCHWSMYWQCRLPTL